MAYAVYIEEFQFHDLASMERFLVTVSEIKEANWDFDTAKKILLQLSSC